ncbi:SDR family NAD(P)-dependent oxidoreductase [Streptomyces sp. p1417]|uniref:SDR family NAD(P)-dependent oxidoreductase n=1 Tax=Streptomyces typhae TaxID=2681492 RepID=A0A6L6X2F1_9ACTN|nr:SDR family NAD(P)-dependent oxidoreductase [Streptomyces typhae]MVO87799.1 SDR family NAD(P)-dependent oxidoreductase [Streptomyces typhae]
MSVPASDRPVALVTRGSRGVGRSVVARLAGAGHDVALRYRSNDAATKEKADPAATGARVYSRAADLSEPGGAREFVTQSEQRHGPVRILVDAAGIARDRSTLCRKAGGTVTLSSVARVHGSAGQTNCSALKATRLGCTRAPAEECGRMVACLVSDRASCITGRVFGIGGGLVP